MTMLGVGVVGAAVVLLELVCASPLQALESNAADRMREVSEIIVCNGHVAIAAMGLQGQPSGVGDPNSCPRSVARTDEPRLDVTPVGAPPVVGPPLAMPMNVGPPSIVVVPPMVPYIGGGGGGGPPPMVIISPPVFVSPPPPPIYLK